MRLKLVGWKLWYAGGITYCSKEGLFKDAPHDRVLEMGAYYRNTQEPNLGQITRTLFGGLSCYFHDDMLLFGSNDNSVDENQIRYPTCSIKRGIWVSREEMEELAETVRLDKGQEWL